MGAFSLYRNVSKIGGGDIKKINRSWYGWIPISYWTRYLRIVPMMIFVTLIQWKISDQLPSGPHTIARGANDAVCSDTWWRILLLIDNLYLSRDGGNNALACMGHLCMFCHFYLLLFYVYLFMFMYNQGTFNVISRCF